MKGKLCGAKKRRKDETCRAPAMPNGRCRIHGGLSLGGIAHPNYKHGGRSKYFPKPPRPSPAALIAAMQAEGLSIDEIEARLACPPAARWFRTRRDGRTSDQARRASI
jgi:hypothetical protein